MYRLFDEGSGTKPILIIVCSPVFLYAPFLGCPAGCFGWLSDHQVWLPRALSGVIVKSCCGVWFFLFVHCITDNIHFPAAPLQWGEGTFYVPNPLTDSELRKARLLYGVP